MKPGIPVDSDSSSVALEIFDELVTLSPSRRSEILDRHAIDPRLRLEVESLLSAYDDAGDFLSEPQTSQADVDPHSTGSRVGAYELLELIGEGGFARVFRARQSRPVQREVALKIIKLGMDTRAVITRFELERQALAMMDHPGVAHVYDAGVTSTGRPFFVMELIHGPRITSYCNEHELDIRQRVGVFIEACRAVGHAHTRGILHRDLKPSNILVATVDDGPMVKVIDFGIAKAIGPLRSEFTSATIGQQPGNFGLQVEGFSLQMLGTPQYMSPEQARSGGADVDTRSDIYSLGAVLHEILVGAGPLEPDNFSPDQPSRAFAPLEQLARLTSADEFARPSTRAKGVARKILQRELDWIFGKCLAKDRARRYDSVASLAADLQAWLDHRPIEAAPPSALYRARKFAHRHALAAVATSLVLISLLVGSIVSTTMAIRARRAERVSQQRFDELRNIALTFMFDIDGKLQSVAGTLPARVSLLEAAGKNLDQLSQHAAGDQTLLKQLAQAYSGLAGTLQAIGDKTGAAAAHDKSLAIYRTLYEANKDDVGALLAYASAIGIRSLTLRDLGKTSEQIDLINHGIELLEKALSQSGAPNNVGQIHGNLVGLYGSLADTLRISGNYDQALAAARKSLDHSRAAPQALGVQSVALQRIGGILELRGELVDAFAAHQAGLDLLLQLPPSHDAVSDSTLARCYARLGHIAWRQGKGGLALENHRKQYEIRKRLAEAEPASIPLKRDLARAMRQLGLALRQADPSGAVAQQQSLDMLGQSISLLETLAPQRPDDLTLLQELAESYFCRGLIDLPDQPVQRITDFEKSITLNRRVLSIDSTDATSRTQIKNAENEIRRLNSEAANVSLSPTTQAINDDSP